MQAAWHKAQLLLELGTRQHTAMESAVRSLTAWFSLSCPTFNNHTHFSLQMLNYFPGGKQQQGTWAWRCWCSSPWGGFSAQKSLRKLSPGSLAWTAAVWPGMQVKKSLQQHKPLLGSQAQKEKTWLVILNHHVFGELVLLCPPTAQIVLPPERLQVYCTQ